VVAIDGAHLAGPGIGDAQIAARRAFEHLALGIDDLGLTPKNGSVAEPGFSASRRAAA
jgi:hypothetical protein